jgi:hypothetical protein
MHSVETVVTHTATEHTAVSVTWQLLQHAVLCHAWVSQGHVVACKQQSSLACSTHDTFDVLHVAVPGSRQLRAQVSI